MNIASRFWSKVERGPGCWLQWICFQRDKRLVIAEIAYVLPASTATWQYEYVTDEGMVPEAYVLEAR